MVTKLFEFRQTMNGCHVRAIEGGAGLSLTPAQIERALTEEGEEDGVKLFSFQEIPGSEHEAWCAFLKELTNNFGPEGCTWVDYGA